MNCTGLGIPVFPRLVHLGGFCIRNSCTFVCMHALFASAKASSCVCVFLCVPHVFFPCKFVLVSVFDCVYVRMCVYVCVCVCVCVYIRYIQAQSLKRAELVITEKAMHGCNHLIFECMTYDVFNVSKCSLFDVFNV